VNAPAIRTVERPERMVAETFDAFRLKSNGTMVPHRADGTPIPVCTAENLDDCVAEMTMQCTHKAQFVVRQTDHRTGETWLHIYQIKQQSKPSYELRHHKYERVNSLYPERVAVVRLPAEAPR
jgi:hypothetical protein